MNKSNFLDTNADPIVFGKYLDAEEIQEGSYSIIPLFDILICIVYNELNQLHIAKIKNKFSFVWYFLNILLVSQQLVDFTYEQNNLQFTNILSFVARKLDDFNFRIICLILFDILFSERHK